MATRVKNSLMYMRVFGDGEESAGGEVEWRQMQEVVYNSLDVVEERLWSARTRNGSTQKEEDGYLGCLAVVGRTRVFGSSTKSVHKPIVVARDANDSSDSKIRAILRLVTEAMVGAFMNCLVAPDAALEGNHFDEQVRAAVRTFVGSQEA